MNRPDILPHETRQSVRRRSDGLSCRVHELWRIAIPESLSSRASRASVGIYGPCTEPAPGKRQQTSYNRIVVSAGLPAVSTDPFGKYALCTYCRTMRWVLKKLALSEMAERITSAYANGKP